MTETEMLSVFGAGMIRDNDMRDTCGHVISGTISRAIIRSNMGARDQRVRNHNKIEECGVKFSRIVLNNIVAAAILNNES